MSKLSGLRYELMIRDHTPISLPILAQLVVFFIVLITDTSMDKGVPAH